MRNFNLLDDHTIQLPSGVFAGVTSYSRYPGGELEGLQLSEKNMLLTHVGELIPAFTENYRRKHKYAVEFFKSGMVKAVYLEAQQEIHTPIGEFPCEMVTFFESGAINRVFPLDGKISGLWTEAEEKSLAIPFSFSLPCAEFTAIISALCFYEEGAIRSITLFPGEIIEVSTKYGKIPARNGFALYEPGELKSLEPAEPFLVPTLIGHITAFDPDALGLSADVNSLGFNRKGQVIALTTVHNRIVVQTPDEHIVMYSPKTVVNPLDDESEIVVGLNLIFDFDEETVTFRIDGQENRYPLKDHGFSVTPFISGGSACSPTDCASCSMSCN